MEFNCRRCDNLWLYRHDGSADDRTKERAAGTGTDLVGLRVRVLDQRAGGTLWRTALVVSHTVIAGHRLRFDLRARPSAYKLSHLRLLCM